MPNVVVVLTDTGATAPAPIVNSFIPFVGTDGDTVFIYGSNFTGATGVQFNGVNAASFTIVNDGLITAVVPTNVTSGNIAVVGSSTTTSAIRFGRLSHGFENY